MDPRLTEIFSICEKYFFANEDPLQVTKSARFFTEGYDAFGLEENQLRQIRDQILEQFNPSIPELAELAYHFFATGKYEFGSLAIMFLKKHRPRFDRSVYTQLKRCLDEVVDNWAHSDLIATKLTPVLLELDIASMDDFAEWRTSPSKWTRRVVAVTMLYQINRLPVEQLLDFIQPLMRDDQRAVQQGVGMFLRELWKVHPREVEDFLYGQKDSASRMIIQYATEKMSKDRKKRYHQSGPKHRKPYKPHYRKDRPPKEEKND
jgi:3-methyladenine DNA glycosylase AlkD